MVGPVTQPPPISNQPLTVSSSAAGIVSLWSGLSASILRQSTYSTARFGLYGLLSRQLQHKSGTSKLSTASTIACAGVAGGLAGMVGNPTEVSRRALANETADHPWRLSALLTSILPVDPRSSSSACAPTRPNRAPSGSATRTP